MSAVSKRDNVVHYYYAVYDTESGEMVNMVDRDQSELGSNMIYSVQLSSKHPATLNLLMRKNNIIKTVNFDPKNGNIKTLAIQEFTDPKYHIY